jgi:hypothetical protein
MSGKTLIPEPEIINARGREIAPHISTSTPKLLSLAALCGIGFSGKVISERFISFWPSISISSSLPAKSKTVETCPCHSGIAIFVVLLISLA